VTGDAGSGCSAGTTSDTSTPFLTGLARPGGPCPNSLARPGRAGAGNGELPSHLTVPSTCRRGCRPKRRHPKESPACQLRGFPSIH
jgi:hypothetical protein